MEQFINIWAKNLSKNDQALEFLASRGVSEEQVDRFRIGWSPRRVKISKEKKVYYEGNRSPTGYIIFPITKINSKSTGFIIRAIKEKAYYKWILESPGAWFFGLDHGTLEEIWKTETIFLVEGGFDFFPLHRISPNTLCLASATLSAQQKQFLARFARRIFFYLDNDATGKRASYYLEKVLKEYELGKIHDMRCKFFSLPYKDIGKAWEEWGDEELKKYILDQVSDFVI